jgi:hypothetical protein
MDFWHGLAEDFNEMVDRLKSGQVGDSFETDDEPALIAK